MLGIVRAAEEAAAAASGAEVQNATMFGTEFILMFNILIAAYLLYYAFKGTGKLYENDYPQAMKEDYAKFMRKFCWIVGAAMLVFTILEFQFAETHKWVSYISMIFVLVAVVFFFVYFRTKFKQYLSTGKKPAKKE